VSGVVTAASEAAVHFGGADRLNPVVVGVLLAVVAVLVVMSIVRKLIFLAVIAVVVLVAVLGFHYGYLPPKGISA
jgi:hypothetical protein